MSINIKKFIAREWIVLVAAAVATFILWRALPQPETFFRPDNPTWIDKGFYALNTRGLLGVAYGILIYGIYLVLRITVGAMGILKRK